MEAIKTAKDFITNLRKSSTEAARFLRKKSSSINNGNNSGFYSSEKEFLAEIYRLLVKANRKYRPSLLIEYHKPGKNGKSAEISHPDIAYYDPEGKKIAVESRAIWYLTEAGGIYQEDIKKIMNDCDKLEGDWAGYDSRVLLVGYLGDPDRYRKGKFQASVEKLTEGNESFSVLTC